MIGARVTRTATYHLHLSWEERLRAHAVPLWSPDGMTRIDISQDQSWVRSGIHATPSEVWGSSVRTAPQSNLLGRRSQLTLSELMQTHFIHTLKELKVGFSAKAHGLCWASITAAALPVAGTGHSVNHMCLNSAEQMYPKAQCTGNRNLRNSQLREQIHSVT